MFEQSFELSWRRRQAVLGAVLVVALAGAIAGCGGDEERDQAQGGEQGGGGGPPPALVRVAPVETRPVQQRRLVTGRLEPVHESLVAAEESGQVIEAPPDVGTVVERGQVLARLDTTLLQRERNVAEADLEQANAQVTEAQAMVEQATAEQKRLAPLVGDGGVTGSEYDAAVRDEQVARARLQTARATVQSRQATLARLDERLKRMVVKAPFDGAITEKHAELGQWLSPGSPVVRLTGTQVLDAVLDVPEQMIDDLDRAAPVPVRVTGLNRKVEGPIHRIVPDADRRARTFPVHVRLDNADGQLSPGMSVEADLPTGQMMERAILVPRDAVQVTPTGTIVYAALDGAAVPMNVHLVFQLGEQFVVEGQLAPGMPVVIEGRIFFPGQPVQVQNGGPPPETPNPNSESSSPPDQTAS